MIGSLLGFFQGLVNESEEAEIDSQAITLAAVALMLEVARSDDGQCQLELDRIAGMLKKDLAVPSDQIDELMALGSTQVEKAHDLYQFTQLINDQCEYAQKKALIYSMWQVAHADGHVADIEEHIIRRIAGLIHVTHADFIRTKIESRQSGDA